MHTLTKVGLDALLTPENCAVLLIDHQPSQLANVNSHDPTMVINNVTALAKTAKAFGVPTILTTINVKRGGELFKQVQAVFPDQKPIDRTFINSWEDRRVVEAVKNTGRKKLVIAALWSEMCLAQPAIHAMGDGYDVYAVTDASGGVSPEAHDMAIRRVVAAGAQPITWLGMAGELQRDWARTERLGAVAQILFDHGDNSVAPAMPLIMERKRFFLGLMALAVNARFNYPQYFVMIPTGPHPHLALTEGFFQVARQQRPRPETVAILVADAPFSQSPAQGAKDNLARQGMRVIFEGKYPLSTTDFTSYMDDLKRIDPDVLFSLLVYQRLHWPRQGDERRRILA